MVYKTEITIDSVNKEDTTACVIGECPKCKRGENTLIINERITHPNIRERQRGNEMIFMRCFVCKSSVAKTKFELTEGNK